MTIANNVSAMQSRKTAKLEDIKPWADSLAKGGYFKQDYARRCVKAVDDVMSIMQPTESHLVEECAAVAPTLVQRWAAATNNQNPGMLRTAQSRFVSILNNYLEYLDNPTSFKPRVNASKSSDSSKRKAKEEVVGASNQSELPLEKEAPAANASAGAPRVSSSGDLRSYPLASGESFDFRLPPGKFTMQDATKVFAHLLTLAADWNPFDPKQAGTLALFRPEPSNSMTVESK